MAQRYQGGILGVGFNPLQAPNAPTIGAASIGAGQVSVAFTAPTNVGGSAVSSYAVRVSPGNFSATGSASPITVSGLTDGTAYTFSVAALNSYGPSPYSGTVTATPGLFVEDVFSTWLYTGTGAAQTITNGINLSGQGGLVWLKSRSGNQSHGLFDTNRGENPYLCTDLADSQFNFSNGVVYNSNGFTNKSNSFFGGSGAGTGQNYVSWTFAKSPKFFDVVTYTGNGTTQNIAHSLGVAPGMIIVKSTSYADDWTVYHRSLGASFRLFLNATNAATNTFAANVWGNNTTTVAPTATQFTIGDAGNLNSNGQSYVAYLFAHDTASDGIIQCGSFTTDGSGNFTAVNLGWEPQWMLIKRSDSSTGGSWVMVDNMRGLGVGGTQQLLANSSNAEAENTAGFVRLTSTGFSQGSPTQQQANATYIYIAIRRGPMRTPTSGTSVFLPTAYSGDGTDNRSLTTLPGMWLSLIKWRTGNTFNDTWSWSDRLRGIRQLASSNTDAETGWTDHLKTYGPKQDTVLLGVGGTVNGSGQTYIQYAFNRAPGFFDEVCYTGTGVARTITHGLTVAPELIIVKRRDTSGNWLVYSATEGATKSLFLNYSDGSGTYPTYWNNTAPTSSVFTVGTTVDANASGGTYVAYLFASCPGVSKIGSYTGNGSSQTINCGFTTGSRFVMIKRTDTFGNWDVFDTARGITVGNDPYLYLNSSFAENENGAGNTIDSVSSGFIVNQSATTNVNVNGATYLYMAIS